MKILVALSGGIDSSVMAHLLASQGHELVGVRFTLWTDPLAPAVAQILPSKCCNAQTAARSAQVAKDLNIPFHVYDLEQEFKENVVDPFLQGYAEGTTPNPCINCNRTIKFGKLLSIADEFGCEMLATGHYARVAKETVNDDERHLLLQALDKHKDQSYYLYGLGQEQLKRVLFPLGGLQKKQVYALAQEFGVPYEDVSYRESQDLCFFPEKSPTEFLKRYLDDVMTPGEIVRADTGEVLGEHKGLPLYTIGQRRVGVGGLQIPLEVVSKDVSSNTLYVQDKGQLQVGSVKLRDVHFVSWQPDGNTPTEFECRLNSLGEKVAGTLTHNGNTGEFTFYDAKPPQAEGQSLVLYRGDEIIGGGVML